MARRLVCHMCSHITLTNDVLYIDEEVVICVLQNYFRYAYESPIVEQP